MNFQIHPLYVVKVLLYKCVHAPGALDGEMDTELLGQITSIVPQKRL